ncbi:MAG: lysophospholipid acyltransferase family protein [Isosphaeraceae bacterium]
MNRLPLADPNEYQFIPPRLSQFWFWAGGFYNGHRLRKEQKIHEIDVQGLDTIEGLIKRGDSVLITPNHPDHADCLVLYELSRRLRRPFSYMAAYQIFNGPARWVLPRVGVFSIDREGADLSAFKAAVNILAEGRTPLVIFPEGEIYRVAERITPLREGAFAIAAAAARKLEGSGRKLWIVPVGLGYRFCDGHDPLPALGSLMDRLETRFTWRTRGDWPLPQRILRYADGVLALKEVEYLGSPVPGPFNERIANLMEQILSPIESRRLRGRRSNSVPERVKDLRRACLQVLAGESKPHDTPQKQQAHADLEDLFLVIQLFSYPADYVKSLPTLERVAETLMKCEEDLLDVDQAAPRAPRRAVVRWGEPIDLSQRIAAPGQARSRQLVPALCTEIEKRLQQILDAMPPGRSLPGPLLAACPAAAPHEPRKDDVLNGRGG